MFATFNCASAASGILGKNVRKSLYSISACCIAVEPPSAYHESATASLARAINSESGYVLISVCSVILDTSKRLCFMASMARSNSTLSGCFEPTFASGFTDFLFVHATVNVSSSPRSAKLKFRRIIQHLKFLINSRRDGRLGRPASRLHSLQTCAPCRFQQRLGIHFRIALAEHRIPRHQNLRPGTHHFRHRVHAHAAIYFDAVLVSPLRPNFGELPQLMQRPRDKLLPPKPRI